MESVGRGGRPSIWKITKMATTSTIQRKTFQKLKKTGLPAMRRILMQVFEGEYFKISTQR